MLKTDARFQGKPRRERGKNGGRGAEGGGLTIMQAMRLSRSHLDRSLSISQQRAHALSSHALAAAFRRNHRGTGKGGRERVFQMFGWVDND